MKTNFIYLLIAIILFSCNAENNIDNRKNNSVVVVEIANAENEKLVLSIQGEDFENRKIETINNGKAIFEVESFDSDIVWIESVYNTENIDSRRWFIPIILDNDTIVVKSKMVKDSIPNSENEFKKYYAFREITFKKSNLNINYKENSKKLFDLGRGISLDWSKLDSYNQNLFPIQRTNALNLFENEFSDLNDRIQLELLNKMLNKTGFRPEYLSNEDREAINEIYYKLSNFDKSASYRLKTVEYQISNINEFGNENQLTFKNFSLIDIKGKKVDLKNIVQQNKLTVFYFWFSSCGPCRSFNQKIDNETMNELNENDIKFVSINTDINKEDWKKSSKQDNIFWQNLYGGNFRDDIEYEYNFRGYPKKVVFNKDLDLVEFSFSKPEDLLKLKELQLKERIK